MECVPPLNRKINDGHVHHAYQGEHGRGPVGTADIVDRCVQRHEAKVQKQQDQLGSQPGIPYPPRTPHGFAPERTCPERQHRHQRAGRGERLRHHRREPRVERKPQGRPRGHDQIDEHRHPRGGDVHKNNAITIALHGVGRSHEKTKPQPCAAENSAQEPEQGNHLARERIEPHRVGEHEEVHHPTVCLCAHSVAILMAVLATHGDPSSENISNAARSDRCPPISRPASNA